MILVVDAAILPGPLGCLILFGTHALPIVEFGLSVHPAFGPRGAGPLAIGSLGSALNVIKVIEVVEHEIHIVVLFLLQVVDDAGVFVHLYPNVSICLPRDCPWLYKIVAVHHVAALGCRNLWPHPHLVGLLLFFLFSPI